MDASISSSRSRSVGRSFSFSANFEKFRISVAGEIWPYFLTKPPRNYFSLNTTAKCIFKNRKRAPLKKRLNQKESLEL